MSMAEEVHHVPSLKRSKYFATLALIIVVVLWIALMVADRFLPECRWWSSRLVRDYSSVSEPFW